MRTASVKPKRVGDWLLEKQIGSGSFSVVWLGVHAVTGVVAAVKEVPTARLNEKLKESLSSELSILQSTQHRNIVRMHEMIREDGYIYLALEYCAGGDLFERIKQIGRAPESFARHCLKQLAAGLQELRKHNLVHRDLKPQNLLLTDDTPDAVLKIADFGFARSLHPQGLAETLCGSPLYMAPEILRFHRYDAKADLWSVGAILYELVVGRPPFDGANHLHLLQNIEMREVTMPEAVRSELSLECRSLIHRLLKKNPVERITFEEFFTDPFISGEDTPEGTSNVVWGEHSEVKIHAGLGLSIVREEEPSQWGMSAGDKSSAATVVHVMGMDSTIDFVDDNRQLQEIQESVSNVLSFTSSDGFDNDYVMVELPNSSMDKGVSASSVSQSKGPDPALKQPVSSLPQSEFLFHVGTLVSELAVAKRDGGCPRDAFAVLLLGVQILDKVMELSKTAQASCVGVDKLRMEMMVAIQQSDQLSGDLSASSELTGTLPNVYDIVFQHALSYSRSAAVDELMGNHVRSHDLYQHALDLLWFLSVEAPNLDLEPPIMLSDEETMRIQQYVMTINARRSACSSTTAT